MFRLRSASSVTERGTRTVGRPVIERQYLAFEQTKTDIRQEGFDEIIELGDEDLDKVQIEIIFRPIPQPPGAPGWRPQGATAKRLAPGSRELEGGLPSVGRNRLRTTQPPAPSRRASQA